MTNSLGGVSPDGVQLFLGTNGIALDPEENASAVKTIVDYIRQDDANIHIYVVYIPYEVRIKTVWVFRPHQTDSRL